MFALFISQLVHIFQIKLAFSSYASKGNMGSFIFLLLARPLPKGWWGRFKYSEDAGYNDLVTAVRLDSLLGLVCKVAPESVRIGGSGRVNRL